MIFLFKNLLADMCWKMIHFYLSVLTSCVMFSLGYAEEEPSSSPVKFVVTSGVHLPPAMEEKLSQLGGSTNQSLACVLLEEASPNQSVLPRAKKLQPTEPVGRRYYRINIDTMGVGLTTHREIYAKEREGSANFGFENDKAQKRCECTADVERKKMKALFDYMLSHLEENADFMRGHGISIRIGRSHGSGFVDCQGVDYVLSELARRGLLAWVTELKLDRNPLGDEGADVIAHWLPHMESIREISLNDCRITKCEEAAIAFIR